MNVGDGVVISRRAVLAAAATGSAAVVAGTMLRPSALLADVALGPTLGVLAVDQVTIPAGKSDATKTLGMEIPAGAIVLCTPLSDLGGRYVSYVEIDAAGGAYKVYLSGKVRKDALVGCALVGEVSPASPPISPPISGPISGGAPVP